MTAIHYAFEARLAAVDSEIAKLKYVCNLSGDDEAVFAQLADPIANPAPGCKRACQTLRGLLFLKTFVRYAQLRAGDALPADARALHRGY